MIGLGSSIATASIQPELLAGGRPSYSNTKSLFLDGTGDYFHPGFTQAQKETFFRNSLTISWWGAYNIDGSSQIVLGFSSNTGAATLLSINLLTFGGTTLFIASGYFNGQGWFSGLIPNGLSGNKTTWVHNAVTITKGASDSDNNIFKIYQNGSLLNTGGTNATTAANMSVTGFDQDVDIAIGARATASGANGHTDMRLDEVAFFDTDLDANNIAGIYNSGSTFDLTSANGNYNSQANLIRYYRLEDNLTDSKGVSDGGTEGDPTFDSDTPDS